MRFAPVSFMPETERTVAEGLQRTSRTRTAVPTKAMVQAWPWGRGVLSCTDLAAGSLRQRNGTAPWTCHKGVSAYGVT